MDPSVAPSAGLDVELAEVNVAIMRAPLDDPSMAGFVFAFDAVARIAESSPGFRWRLKTGDGHAVVAGEGAANQVVNVSVWSGYAALHTFTYRGAHGLLLPRRREWFLPGPQPSTALWWVPTDDRPTLVVPVRWGRSGGRAVGAGGRRRVSGRRRGPESRRGQSEWASGLRVGRGRGRYCLRAS